MGLFGKIKSGVDTAQNAVNDARSKAVQAKAKVADMKNSIDPRADHRPFAPQEVLFHEQHECIKVYGTRYNQEAVDRLVGDTVVVAILKDKNPEWDSYPVVNANDGALLGAVYDEQLRDAGLRNGYTAIAEIHRPVYYGQSDTQLYLPRTAEAIERKKQLDALKFWGNLDYSKWEQPHGQRFDYGNVSVLTDGVESGKPLIVVIGDGVKLFEVNPKMKMYKELSERLSYKPRRLIVEANQGERGPYYRTGFYY